MYPRMMPAGRLLSFLVLLFAGVLVGSHATAQQGGDKKKGTRHSAGGWLNSPTGIKFRIVNDEASLEFVGERTNRTASRVRAGTPMVHKTSAGTAVARRKKDRRDVVLHLTESDGRIPRVTLPKQFHNGLMYVQNDFGASIVVPISGTSQPLDVPALVRFAELTGSRRIYIEFLALHNGQIDIVTTQLRVVGRRVRFAF